MIDLRKVRQEKGLTQNALAENVGVIRQTISNIECGLNRPSPELAMKLGEILEIDWSKFFTEES